MVSYCSPVGAALIRGGFSVRRMGPRSAGCTRDDETVYGRVIVKSANQILPPRFCEGTEIHNPPFLFGGMGLLYS